MATIVKHKTGGHYIVIGFGYGMFQASRPGVFFGDLAPNEKSGENSLLAVSDDKGRIGVVRPQDCTVIEVDGKRPDQILHELDR